MRTMTKQHPHSPEKWENAIIFPNGHSVKISNESSLKEDIDSRKGEWLTIAKMKAANDKTRLVPQTIIPYGSQTVHLQLVRFESMAALHDHVKDVQTEVPFCQTNELPPVEAGLYAYMAIAPK